MIHLLIVGIGGFFGAIARYSLSKSLHQSSLPIGTLTVNLSGSLMLGVMIGLKTDPRLALLFGAGFLGSFTTFSTLQLELKTMWKRHRRKQFYVYLTTTYGLGLLFAVIGYWLGSELS